MKIIYFLSSIMITALTLIEASAAGVSPKCDGLPGCNGGGIEAPFTIIGNLIAVVIQYIAVIAVIALMYGGILYLISSGDEEKTKKAKNVILWALVGVLVSISAFAIINMLNYFNI